MCIVGGGPAGLSAAIALSLAGKSVRVLETNRPPIDKACGEGLMPDTLEALHALGIRLSGGFPLRGIRFISAGTKAQADFTNGHGLGLRRTLLHQALIARASELNIDLHWNTPHGFPRDARLLVGADGQNSRIRRAEGFSQKQVSCRYGFRCHYALEPWCEYVEVYWDKRRQIYVTPVAPDQIDVALLTHNPPERLQNVLPHFPALFARLQNARRVSSEMGALTTTRVLRNVCRDHLALIGDASGSVDAITGEGIGLAVRQAIALAEALRKGDLAAYEVSHRRIMRRPRIMARLLLLMSRSTALQKIVIPVFARAPLVFDALLAAHVCSGTVTAAALTGPSLPNPDRLKIQS